MSRKVVVNLGLASIVLVGLAGKAGADEVINWNVSSLSVIALSGQNNPVQTRSMTMVHAAVHDALNAIERRYEPYAFHGHATAGASPDAAVAAAAHGVLVGVIPSFGTPAQQAAAIAAANAALAASLAAIPDGAAKTHGIAVGRAAAAAMVAERSADGATAVVPYTSINEPGHWQPTPNPVPPDPLSGGPGFLPPVQPGWADVTPFVLNSGEQFRPDGPPDLDSEEYEDDYNEVAAIGDKDSLTRTAEQSSIARFWYEPSHVGWNRIARTVAATRALDPWKTARLFALLNAAMADGFISGWNARYFYDFWRPVTAIRAGDTDGNDATVADPDWQTFLNTPAIPEYPSTHSVLGAAAAEVLARFFGHGTAFMTTSGAPFPGLTRSFASFSQAAQENADSRVYAGVHFRTACRDGIQLGHKIGKFTFKLFAFVHENFNARHDILWCHF